MSQSPSHTSFSLERVFSSAPAKVFAAWSDAAAKAQWFTGGSDWTPLERQMDFRPGGRERAVGKWHTGVVTAFDATYYDIVPNERIVYGYDMHVDGGLISVSLATIELFPEKKGTRLRFTEQAVFLNGYDDSGSRERGTSGLLDQLSNSLS